MQMEVLESDMQSQEETETVDDFAPDFHEEKIDCTEDLEEDLQFQNMIDEADEAEYLDPKELNAGDSLDMKIQLKQAHFDPNEVEMLETTECNDIPVNENNTRDVQDTRRRRRSKISDWVIQYPEPDPEEVEVINEEKNIIQYSIQRLEETEEDENAIREDEDAAAVSLNIEKAIQGPSPTRMADTRNELYE
uniref:Uncharacterized protein n=1 Tax=Anopheles christyi TaxID=43041 RepID=A0A182KGT9_9DIPT